MEKQGNAGFWLSPQQKHVWLMQQQGGAGRSACVVTIDGPLQADKLKQALQGVVARHEILRTVLHRQTGMKVPFQVILESDEPGWQTADSSSLSDSEQERKLPELAAQEQTRSFNPEQGPVLDATLLNRGKNRAALLLSLPAWCVDSQSWKNLIAEIGSLYAGTNSESEEPLRYVQFAQWQNDLLEADDDSARQGKEFWSKLQSADLPPLVLPQERKTDGFSPAWLAKALDAAVLNKLEALASKHDATIANVLLAGWQSLVWRLTGQTSFALDVAFDGREYEELQGAIGLFERRLPIPARFEGDFRFREVVEHARDAMHQAAEWQEHFVLANDGENGTAAAFDNVDLGGAQQVGELRWQVLEQRVCSERFKLKLSAVRRQSGLTLEFHYDSARLDRHAIERIASYFQTLLGAAVDQPETAVSRLPLLNSAQRQQLLVEWNQTAADYSRELCLHSLFEAQAAHTPDRPALRFQDQQLSFRELNRQANRLAHYLRSLGVGPDALVGLAVERSAEMMVAVLAILKAGGAYVPLNPDNPKPRLAQQTSGMVALITQQNLLELMPELSGKTLCLDRDQSLWSGQSDSNPTVQTTPENLVYVIYTSGSTGVPKGVAVRHRNLVNYSEFIVGRLELEKCPDGLQFATVSTLGADLGNTCIFPALISGGCLHVLPYEVATDATRFAAYTTQHPLDVLKIVPSHLQALLQGAEAKQVLPRKYLITGGETLTPQLIERITQLNPACEILNHYGPTETTVGSLTLRLNEYDWKQSVAASIPIGRPIANTQVYILDAHLQPVPVGVIGELYIAGAGVTGGYLNQPERTAERFVRNPFVNDAHAKMYRTGDLARYGADGNVEFLGRGDDQVKIRGFRIELGEIESVLTQHAGVKQAVVLAKADERGDKKLLAYVVANREPAVSSDDLRAYLKQQLPDYMVPSAVVLLPKLPLTANGKIDRQALPAPEAVAAKEYVAPRTPTEEVVAGIWAEVLRLPRVSTQDNFFDLGGHSLLATQVVSRVREQFRVELPIRILFEKPTVCGLAEAILAAQESGADSSESAILPVSREAYRAGRS